MNTQRKTEANRRNAQQSTGPRTPTGNAITSMNALKHGLCARKPVVPGEDEAEYARFAAEWVDHLRPSDPHQNMLAEQVILAAWQLRRVPQVRAALLTAQMKLNAKYENHPYRLSSDGLVDLSRIDRHQVMLERSFRQAIKELREEQSADSADYTEVQNEATEEQPLTDEPLTPGSERVPPTRINAPEDSGGRIPVGG